MCFVKSDNGAMVYECIMSVCDHNTHEIKYQILNTECLKDRLLLNGGYYAS